MLATHREEMPPAMLLMVSLLYERPTIPAAELAALTSVFFGVAHERIQRINAAVPGALSLRRSGIMQEIQAELTHSLNGVSSMTEPGRLAGGRYSVVAYAARLASIRSQLADCVRACSGARHSLISGAN